MFLECSNLKLDIMDVLESVIIFVQLGLNLEFVVLSKNVTACFIVEDDTIFSAELSSPALTPGLLRLKVSHLFGLVSNFHGIAVDFNWNECGAVSGRMGDGTTVRAGCRFGV